MPEKKTEASKRQAPELQQTPAKVPRSEASSPASSDSAAQSSVLESPVQQGSVPEGPQRPTGRQVTQSEWTGYWDRLVQYVIQHLPTALTACGINVGEGGLHCVPPANIEKNPSGGQPAIGGTVTTCQETWNMDRCHMAMKTTGKYEAAGSLWWVQLVGTAVKFQNSVVFEAEADRAAVDAASVLWDDAAFKASDLTEHRRRFNFPGILPTACTGFPDVSQQLPGREGSPRIPTFRKLPLVAGSLCAPWGSSPNSPQQIKRL